MAKLYALLDFDSLQRRGYSLEKFLPLLKDAALLQYRDKTNPPEIQKQNLLFLKRHFHNPVLINDRLELAKYCDGLHLGQEDLLRYGANGAEAAAYVRQRLGEKLFGLSTHDREEILEANTLPLDYIGLGAYRATGTKKDACVLGEKLPELALYSSYPVAAIGGVKKDEIIENVTYNVVGSGLYEG